VLHPRNQAADPETTRAWLEARELHRLEQREMTWRGRPEYQVRQEMEAALARWQMKHATQRG
jgi:hypothetical protein